MKYKEQIKYVHSTSVQFITSLPVPGATTWPAVSSNATFVAVPLGMRLGNSWGDRRDEVLSFVLTVRTRAAVAAVIVSSTNSTLFRDVTVLESYVSKPAVIPTVLGGFVAAFLAEDGNVVGTLNCTLNGASVTSMPERRTANPGSFAGSSLILPEVTGWGCGCGSGCVIGCVFPPGKPLPVYGIGRGRGGLTVGCVKMLDLGAGLIGKGCEDGSGDSTGDVPPADREFVSAAALDERSRKRADMRGRSLAASPNPRCVDNSTAMDRSLSQKNRCGLRRPRRSDARATRRARWP